MSKYLQVKRQNQTYCITCDPSETVLDVKRKVVSAANQHCGEDEANKTSAEFLQILKTTEGSSVVEDDVTVGDLPDTLYLVLQVNDDEWEPVDVVSTDIVLDA